MFSLFLCRFEGGFSIKRDYGGAYKCYKHAQELGVPIMNIADNIKNQEW